MLDFNFQDLTAVMLVAVVMIVVGFGFKISAVPFHWWAPDTYEGAPTAFTGFVSTASKAAGFAIFLRVFTAGVFGTPTSAPQEQAAWWALLVVICVITMTLGNLSAIFQHNLKRMLAYSSVAQAGYALIGLIIFTQDGYGASMFYLLMYAFTNIAAFGVIIIVSNASNSDQMEDFYGLSRRSPYLALVMMIALLSLGGIPPHGWFYRQVFPLQSGRRCWILVAGFGRHPQCLCGALLLPDGNKIYVPLPFRCGRDQNPGFSCGSHGVGHYHAGCHYLRHLRQPGL
ncbi:MAG: NADH-quinone oxidoreductase subunit N [Anaerolineae bacterium]|nr:NADH-quinone oxidoreductase subunit N [Anaerolineae bacterium]